MAQSGYSDCRCRDCFEIAISDDMMDPDFCWECSEAGCGEEEECRCEGQFDEDEDEV